MISDIFKLRQPNKYGHWGLELRAPFRTTDSKAVFTRGPIGTGARARDAILSPPTQSEYAENARRVATMTGLDLGRVWAGDLKPKLDAIRDRKQLGDALSALVSELANYGTERGRQEGSEIDGTGALTFQGDELRGGREEDITGHKTGDAMRRWRNEDHARIEATQKANVKFYGRKPAA
jgi:hypothetical protein